MRPPLRAAALLLLPGLLAACSASPTIPSGTEIPVTESFAGRNSTEWDLPSDANQPALAGYDPVSYFPEGGGVPLPGDPTIAAEVAGVRYIFSSGEHRARFLADPARYEPAHGGWCSWAMREGTKTEVDPRSFIVRDGRLFLFYDGIWGDTRAMWEETDHAASVAAADAQWQELSGEAPRGAQRD